MRSSVLRWTFVVLIAGAVGVATSAAAFALIPDPGSAPSIYDDFNWNSTANGFWHVNATGASVHIKNSLITLSGDNIELDRRLQTDPRQTIIVAKVRGLRFHKMALGIGLYHAGTVGMEFDNDGVKCGRASDYGYRVDYMQAWTKPPVGQWYYLEVAIVNPYPDPSKIPNVDDKLLKKIMLRCSVYDTSGRLVASGVANRPPSNAHYVGFDEAYFRTWDNNNKYQLDWFYAGPPSGNPLNLILNQARQRPPQPAATAAHPRKPA